VEEKLGIAGGGAIACGLAAAAAQHGNVVLWARSDASADRARRSVEKHCSKLNDGAHTANVVVETDLDALSEASFLVEAVVEELDAKAALLGRLGAVAGDGAIVGSTTSSLSVQTLATASGRAESFVGLHVFNPVPRMKLVELAYPREAGDEVRVRARALCEALDKVPVDVPDTPGFVVNRLLFPYLFSAVDFLVESGMEPKDVDTCMQLGAGHPMGPLALLDFVGLDVSEAIGDAIGANVPSRVRELVREGALGKKSGRGFYDYG
jgi:3-hydroxybutyryl-CoA dehydrogenase